MIKMAASSVLTSTIPFKECSTDCFATSVSASPLQRTVKVLALCNSSTNFEISSVLLLPGREFFFRCIWYFSLLLFILLQNCFCWRRCKLSNTTTILLAQWPWLFINCTYPSLILPHLKLFSKMYKIFKDTFYSPVHKIECMFYPLPIKHSAFCFYF